MIKTFNKLCNCSVTQSCPTLCDPMDCSMSGSSVLHYLLKFAQIHVHWVGDAIQPSCPLYISSEDLLYHANFLLYHGVQHTRLPCPSPTSRACSNSYLSSQWCHPGISSSIVSFSFCLQSFPASGSFPISQFFASGGQSIGVSASGSVLPMNIQDWLHLGLTGLISLQCKGLSSIFNTTVQKHQFFGTQLSL